MSNLTSTVKFDVLRGWPWGGAIEESFVPASGKTYSEGVLVSIDSSGNAADVPSAVQPWGAGTGQPVMLRMVIQGNDQFDGSFVGKAVTLRGEFTVKTEKYTGTIPAKGAYVTWDPSTSGKVGWLKTAGATDQWVGQVEDSDSTNGFIVVAMSL